MRAALAGGDLGVALWAAYHHRVDLDAVSDAVASDVAERALDATPSDRFGITSGVAGIGFAVEHLGYNRDDDLIADADDALVELVASRPPLIDHAMFRGVAGIAVYAIERLPRPRARDLLAAAVVVLDATAHRDRDGAWWTTGDRVALDPAHGVVGPIVALAGACAHGVAAEVARPLLDQAVAWLWSRRIAGADAWFPTFAGGAAAGAGWCRGDVGIAAALHAAGRAVAAPWITDALELARFAARRDPDASRVGDPAFCHGAAGVAHIFGRLFNTTGEIMFRDAARTWLDRLLAMRRPDGGIGGFFFEDIDGSGAAIADPSLLFGAAGVGLVLLAATTDVEPAWDRCLLVSVREP